MNEYEEETQELQPLPKRKRAAAPKKGAKRPTTMTVLVSPEADALLSGASKALGWTKTKTLSVALEVAIQPLADFDIEDPKVLAFLKAGIGK